MASCSLTLLPPLRSRIVKTCNYLKFSFNSQCQCSGVFDEPSNFAKLVLHREDTTPSWEVPFFPLLLSVFPLRLFAASPDPAQVAQCSTLCGSLLCLSDNQIATVTHFPEICFFCVQAYWTQNKQTKIIIITNSATVRNLRPKTSDVLHLHVSFPCCLATWQ